MKSFLRKYGISLFVSIGGTLLLGTIWWVNGREVDDLWLYFICVWLMLYAAYEVFAAGKKRKK